MHKGRGRRVASVVVFIVLASLDNVAIGLVPPLYGAISADLGTRQSTIGLTTAVTFVVSSVASVGWAYVGDRTNRKPLLMAGTTIWAAGGVGTALSTELWQFFACQLGAAVGLGAVGSVGFSVVSDLISPRRRGLVMSLWGLSQGVGTISGTVVGGLLGARDWRQPFWVVAGLGLAATLAYLLTADIRRGQSEPELARLYAAGGEYSHRISLADLLKIARCRTNLLLVLQGLAAQVTFGSLVWLPQLLRARAEAQGYSAETATAIGSLYAALFQLGGVFSIVGGLLGDRLRHRVPGGRALVAGIGLLAGIPLYVGLFFMPISSDVPDGAGMAAVATAVLGSLFTEPVVAVTFLLALVALALTSANAPNWFALVADVNPPERRGTVYSVVNLVNGVGRAAGNGFAGLAFRWLGTGFAAPTNYSVGLAAFQIFFVPAGICFLLAARTVPGDAALVRETLRSRGETGPGARVQE
jgi:MFS family permease